MGSCTWRCYTRSITERSLSLGPVARKFWFPADMHLSIKYQIRKSYLRTVFHDTTRKHGTHGLQRGWTLWENTFILLKSVWKIKTRPFWCTGSLGLRQVQSILSIENLEVNISLLTQIMSLIPRREKRFRETWCRETWIYLWFSPPSLYKRKESSLYRAPGRRDKVGLLSFSKVKAKHNYLSIRQTRKVNA